MKIPVIINNRDLLTWPKAMVERISRYDNVGDIVIIDNASTNKELIQWYKTGPCNQVIASIENKGHTAPWDLNVVKFYNQGYYVVTDSDLDLSNTPDDTLQYLLEKEKELKLGKVGLGLEWWRVKPESPYYNHMQNYEVPRWNNTTVKNGVFTNIAIDTTFALYSVPYYFIGGGSTGVPYTARHLPWEFTVEEREKDAEFMYYIKNASNSSSYKTFLRL